MQKKKKELQRPYHGRPYHAGLIMADLIMADLSFIADLIMAQVLEAAGFGYWLLWYAVQGWGCLLLCYGLRFNSSLMVWVGEYLVIASDRRLALEAFLPTCMAIAQRMIWHHHLAAITNTNTNTIAITNTNTIATA